MVFPHLQTHPISKAGVGASLAANACCKNWFVNENNHWLFSLFVRC
jgi:hypothetical protein